MIKIAVYFFILFIPLTSIAQQRTIDSLELIVQDPAIKDKDKIIAYSQLSGFTEGNFDRSLKYSRQSIALALQQKEAYYAVYAYSNLGLLYALKGDAEKVYSLIDSCHQYIEKSTDIRANAVGLNRVGVMKLQLDDKDGLVDIYKSVDLLNNTVDNCDIQSSNYYILGSSHESDMSKLEQYSQLSLENALKSKKPNVICLSWSMRGIRYLLDPKQKDNTQYLDSAITCFKKAIDVYNQSPQYVRDITYISLLTNAAYTYQLKNELRPDKANGEQIDYYIRQAAPIKEKNHDIEFLVNYYQLLILGATNKKDQADAERINLEAIAELSKYDGLYKLKYSFYYNLASLYKEQKQFEKSTEYFEKSLEFYKEYYDQNSLQIGEQQHAKYELAKKEQIIEFTKKQNQLYIGLVVFLAFCLLFFLLFFVYRVKYYKEKRRLLKQEKEEAALLLRLKEEENKVLEVSKQNIELEIELKTQETNKLQKEALAKNLQVDHKNKILEDLQQYLHKKPDSRFINMIIKSENQLDKSFDEFASKLSEIHPEFYNKLQAKARQKLTTLELKYCVYIYMKMPSKEMADLLYVELKTIRMNKYRLKQKLGLGKDEDLENFIQNII